MLWAALFQVPLMIAVQECCGRIGAVTGKGLARVIGDRYGRGVLYGAVTILLVANTVNVGVDIGAIVVSFQLVWALPFVPLAILTTALVVALELFVGYWRYSHLLKYLGCALLAYLVTMFSVHEPWAKIIQATFVPHVALSTTFLLILIGVLGTTITPYCFFWQASQEVEEEQVEHLIPKDGPVLDRFLRHVRTDTIIGMLFSNVVQWSIIVVCATVLFSHGITQVGTAAQAASALKPFAGRYASDLFALGVIGVGLMAIPVLSGSSAYALTETFGWREGLNQRVGHAPAFYGVIVASGLVGLLINFIGVDPIKALVWTAVLNGVLSVPLLFIIARLNSDGKVLGKHTGGRLSRTLLWADVGVMVFALVGTGLTL